MNKTQKIYEEVKKVIGSDPDFFVWLSDIFLREKSPFPSYDNPREFWSESLKHLKKAIDIAENLYSPDHVFIKEGQKLIEQCQNYGCTECICKM